MSNHQNRSTMTRAIPDSISDLVVVPQMPNEGLLSRDQSHVVLGIVFEVEVFVGADVLDMPTAFGVNGLPLLVFTAMAWEAND